MIYLKSFRDFLDSTKEGERYDLSSKGKIKRGTWEKITIAKNYINIIDVFFVNSFSNGVNLDVAIESPNGKIKDEIGVKVLYTGGITNSLKELFGSIKSFLVSGYEEEVLKLFDKYFKFCIRLYIHKNPCILAKCGWISLEKGKAFLSVNYCNSIYPDTVADLFNGNLRKLSPQLLSLERLFDLTKKQDCFKKIHSDFEDFCSRNNNLEKLFSFILNDRCMLIVFSYSIHSFFWDYLRNYNISRFVLEEIPNKHSVIFSLCIYGKDPKTSKIIANLLGNFFTISNNKWATIHTRYHISSTSLSQSKFDKLIFYKSVPVIVTSKTNHFTKASSIIRKLHQKRVASLFHCYPVYISDTPVIVDEMINCCSDLSIEKLEQINYDDLNEMYFQFCYLIYDFICHLTKISNQDIFPNREDAQYFSLNIYELIEDLHLSEERIDNHVPNYLLYSTMNCFCRYLESTPLRCYVDKLKEFSEVCFLPGKQTEKRSELTDQEHELENLHLFYQFIHNNLKPKNKSWIWDGKETRGQEDCYYLASVEGYKAYNDFITKKTKFSITKSKLIKLLKDYQILKTSGSKSSNAMKRKNMSEEYIYVLVLLKEKLDLFSEEVST